MELDIGTVTRTRHWSKALFRIRPKIKVIENLVESLDLIDSYCEVLQIIFQDEGTAKSDSDGFVKAEKVLPKNKIKQVSMIVPSDFTFKRDGSEDEELYIAVIERTITAIRRSPLKEQNKELLEKKIRENI
jgi:hypothetical protein